MFFIEQIKLFSQKQEKKQKQHTIGLTKQT